MNNILLSESRPAILAAIAEAITSLSCPLYSTVTPRIKSTLESIAGDTKSNFKDSHNFIYNLHTPFEYILSVWKQTPTFSTVKLSENHLKKQLISSTNSPEKRELINALMESLLSTTRCRYSHKETLSGFFIDLMFTEPDPDIRVLLAKMLKKVNVMFEDEWAIPLLQSPKWKDGRKHQLKEDKKSKGKGEESEEEAEDFILESLLAKVEEGSRTISTSGGGAGEGGDVMFAATMIGRYGIKSRRVVNTLVENLRRQMEKAGWSAVSVLEALGDMQVPLEKNGNECIIIYLIHHLHPSIYFSPLHLLSPYLSFATN